MALNDVYGTRWQFRDHGRVWTINLNYKDTTGVAEESAAADLGAGAYTLFGTELNACRATDSTFEGIYIWKITKDTGIPDMRPYASVAGTSGEAESTSPNNCAVFTLQTTDPLAKRFGRIYLAGLPYTWLAGGQWNITAMTAFTALATKLQTVVTGSLGSYQPVILRRVAAGAPLVPPVPSDVSVVATSNIVYSQRRRNSRQLGYV